MWVLIRQIIQFYAQQLSHNKQWVLTNGEFAKLSLAIKKKLDLQKRKMNLQSSDLIVFRL